MKRRQSLLLLAALAASPLQRIVAAPRVYLVGVEQLDYYPISAARPPEFRYEGYAREVLDQFAALEGIEFRYMPMPPRRMSAEYWNHRLDFIFPDNPHWNKTEQKERNITYSQPVVIFQDAVLVLPENRKLPRAQLKSLGSIYGWTPWKFKGDIDAGKLHVEYAPSPESLIRMTLARRVEGANLALQVARYHLKQLGNPDALVVNQYLLTLQDSFYSMSSIRHPELIRRFDKFLQANQARLAALRSRYGL